MQIIDTGVIMGNKKIGTITFHWATNYGAVIQAYALQQCLTKLGFETEIINYVPRRTTLINALVALKNRNLQYFNKEHHISKFRNKYLKLSGSKIGSSKKLKRYANQYTHIVAGSDQIWNYSFTMGAEGGQSLSYFLNFAGQNTKKISYAASFGMDIAPDDYIKVVSPLVKQFDGISVRENTGVKIAEQLGVRAEIVCDPTLLLRKEDYELLLSSPTKGSCYIYSYILHGRANDVNEILEAIKKNYPDLRVIDDNGSGIVEWLSNIRDAKYVITNSFHGMMFSLIFNTPFVVVPVIGTKMNDRIMTVLSSVGLMDRIVEDAYSIPQTDIDWDSVNSKLEENREKGIAYLKKYTS